MVFIKLWYMQNKHCTLTFLCLFGLFLFRLFLCFLLFLLLLFLCRCCLGGLALSREKLLPGLGRTSTHRLQTKRKIALNIFVLLRIYELYCVACEEKSEGSETGEYFNQSQIQKYHMCWQLQLKLFVMKKKRKRSKKSLPYKSQYTVFVR